jgi:hypothetical protein
LLGEESRGWSCHLSSHRATVSRRVILRHRESSFPYAWDDGWLPWFLSLAMLSLKSSVPLPPVFYKSFSSILPGLPHSLKGRYKGT